MPSTIKDLIMRSTLAFSGLLLMIGASTGHANEDINAQSSCNYNEEAMLALSPREFDQDLDNGWRQIVQHNTCHEAAANLIRSYYTKHDLSSGAMRTFVWHEGQLRAEVGQYQQAVRLMKQAKKAPDTDISGWNYYVDATIAFLQSDKNALKAERAKLAAVPKPEGFNPTDADGRPIDVKWPPNLEIVDKFIRCFEHSYADAYTQCAQ